MIASLKALLSGVIDYAGMFPPASLPLSEATARWRSHRTSRIGWMLGRFVCPASALPAFAELYNTEKDGSVAVVMRTDPAPEPARSAADVFPKTLTDTLTAMDKFPDHAALQILELKWPTNPDASSDSTALQEVVQRVTGELATAQLSAPTVFFEAPAATLAALQSPDGPATTKAAVTILANYNKSASPQSGRAGFKLRMGGDGPSAVPATETVAAAVCACRDAGLFWKATAGLHHPLRHIDADNGGPGHGFLNLLTAAVFADVHALDENWTRRILDDTEPHHFQFSEEKLTWCGESVTTHQIATARQRGLRSFGSCSVIEPSEELGQLGLL